MKKLRFVFLSAMVALLVSALSFGQDLSRANLQNSSVSPDEIQSVTLMWDDGVNFDAIGLTAGGSFDVGARFPASVTGPYAGYELQQIEVYINDAPSNCTIKIYDQGTAVTPGALLLTQDVTSSVIPTSWNTFTLSSPVAITGNDIWVTYSVTHGAGQFPCGVDDGPAVVDGDWIYTSGTWQRLSVIAPTLNYNWNIHAILEQGGSSTNFFDDFEAYTAGQQLACQNPTVWTTWSNLPCDATEDAYISSNHAYSGSNSVVIVQNNDLVKPLGNPTSGKWYMSFNFYIPTGKAGYFNMLSGFTPDPYEWGLECYLDAGGVGRFFGGSATAITFNWTENTWHFVQVVVDLDLDQAQFFYEGNMVHSWQWTLGANGGGSALKIAGTDHFGATANDEMYMDDYWFGDTPLPVELTSFAANVNANGHVVLNWSTATEINNQMFEIQRSNSNTDFVTIGYVNGAGTTTEEQNYSYTDRTVATGNYSYRLKQIDFDGSYHYSSIVEVDVQGPLTFALLQNYPNPFNPTTNIKYSVPTASNVKLAVYNTIGEEVAVLVNGFVQEGFYEVTFNASSLPSGVYFYKLQSGNTVEMKKMMLLK